MRVDKEEVQGLSCDFDDKKSGQRSRLSTKETEKEQPVGWEENQSCGVLEDK
jgi:hypothetical protein